MARRGITGLSVGELQAEIARRQRSVGRLMRVRKRLLTKLHSVEADIAAAGGSGRGMRGGRAISGRSRPRNAQTLVEALAKVLSGKTMSVTEVAEAVQKAGYQTTSPAFRTIVNQTLINSGRFKRVSRGKYTAK